MATTITFSFCPNCDCTGFNFYDTTGLQPGKTNGYEASADVQLFTGRIEIFDTTLSAPVRTYSVTPSTDATVSIMALWTENNQTALPDGVYQVKYSVFNDSGILVGFQQQIILLDCNCTCDLLEIARKSVAASGPTFEKYVEVLNHGYDYLSTSRILANGGQMDKASEVFDLAKKFISSC